MKYLIQNALDYVHLQREDHRDARRLAELQRKGFQPVSPTLQHMEAAINWICRAQDAVSTIPRQEGGVAWGYCGRTRRGSAAPVGWRAAYPETTGYIIETIGRHAKRTGRAELLDRIKRMADWELAIQLPNGGIQGGRSDATPVDASTFVTGQVIFGWVWAFREFGNPAYSEAAKRAGDWLLSCLDDQGRFIRGYSHFCSPGPKAYEARTGWALAQLGDASGDARYSDAARSMSQFALSQRQANGWFALNDLEDNNRPLTHTIGYVLEGVLETGWLLNEPSFEEAVRDSLRSLEPLVGENGFLAGRFTSDWRPAVASCCLTGSSQIALVCLRLHRKRPDPALLRMAERLLSMVSATQLSSGFHPGLLGGIHGSYPFEGEYGRYCVLNWATKFYIDAVAEWLGLSDGFQRADTTIE